MAIFYAFNKELSRSLDVFHYKHLFVVFCLSIFVSVGAEASDILDILSARLKDHDRVVAAKEDVATVRNRLSSTKADWFPNLDITLNYGYENQDKIGNNPDTSLHPRSFGFKLTQKIWDFGKTNSAISISELELEQRKEVLNATKQRLLLELLASYLDFRRNNLLVEFAVRSEQNITNQTGVEQARVEQGIGYPTDVLQAKTQLSSAQATRVQRQGDLRKSMHRYVRLFAEQPMKIQEFGLLHFKKSLLPANLEDAIELALLNNLELSNSKFEVEIGKSRISRTYSDEFFPELNLIASTDFKKNIDGTIGSETEYLVKVELSYQFNLGLKSVDVLRASKSSYRALVRRHAENRDILIERVRNAWQDLETARERSKFLNNQVEIAGRFLELARKERKSGTRSLIDILVGETSLIRAKSDVVSVRTDIAIAGFSLLFTMGNLSLDAVVIE